MVSKRGTQLCRDYENIFCEISAGHSELWDFTYVHKAVTGILHVDLHRTLQDPIYSAVIDMPDSQGRTPLLWAALRGDEHALRTLLRAGAKTSPIDWERRSALHSAVVSGSTGCVELLLLAGSNVHSRDIHGDTALQMAAWANDQPQMLEKIFLAGASLNDQNANGVTPLQCAVDLNHHQNVRLLLEMGANLESRDKDNDSPLFEAIRYSNIEALKVLLEYGPRFDHVNKTNQTALHIAAMEADRGVLQVLVNASMDGLDPSSRDWKNRTVLEAFNDRVHYPNGFKEDLEHLVGSVSCNLGDDDEGVREIYFDASED